MRWVSKHSFVMPATNKSHLVDAAGIGGSLPDGSQGICPYPGRSWTRFGIPIHQEVSPALSGIIVVPPEAG